MSWDKDFLHRRQIAPLCQNFDNFVQLPFEPHV
jgi:hypothetical protein